MNKILYDCWNAFLVIFKIKKEIYKNNANNEQERQRRELESQILDEATDSIKKTVDADYQKTIK